jgi:hypothetical protein
MSVGAYANSPAYMNTGYNPTLYGYNTTGNPGYGLYGNNPSMIMAESPYARMTNQLTPLSATAIPNLSSFTQPMFVDMNAFTGNTSGIPMLPSFIGAASMQNSNKPLYTSFNQYLAQNYPQSQNNYASYGYGNPQQVVYPQQPQQPQFPQYAFPSAQASGSFSVATPTEQLSLQFSAQTPPQMQFPPGQGYNFIV